MHGRPRKSSRDGGSQEKDMAKAAGLQSLQTQFFKNHHEKIYTKEALQLNAKLLEINPEIYTAWNYRKLAIKQLLESEPDNAVIKQSLDEELRVVYDALFVAMFFLVMWRRAGGESFEKKLQVIWCMAPPQMGDSLGLFLFRS